MKQGARTTGQAVEIQVLEGAIRSAAERRNAHTESRRMIEASRLLMLGHLARGVAHEISNPVNNMVTAAEWMLDLLGEFEPAACPDRDELAAAAEVVRANGMRCKDIVLRLLTYCGAGDPRARDVDLAGLLKEILSRRVERVRKLGVEVELDLSPDLPPVHAAAAELDEALSALVDNALDALDDLLAPTAAAAAAAAAQLGEPPACADAGPGSGPKAGPDAGPDPGQGKDRKQRPPRPGKPARGSERTPLSPLPPPPPGPARPAAAPCASPPAPARPAWA